MTEPRPTPRPIKFDPASLKFNDQGLIPAIAQAHGTGEVLMMAWMNAASVAEKERRLFALLRRIRRREIRRRTWPGSDWRSERWAQ